MKENSSRSHTISTFFRKLSLVQKFSASAILLILVLMAVVSGLIVTYQRQALRTEMEKNHLLLMRSLSKDAVEPLIVMDPLRQFHHRGGPRHAEGGIEVGSFPRGPGIDPDQA